MRLPCGGTRRNRDRAAARISCHGRPGGFRYIWRRPCHLPARGYAAACRWPRRRDAGCEGDRQQNAKSRARHPTVSVDSTCSSSSRDSPHEERADLVCHGLAAQTRTEDEAIGTEASEIAFPSFEHRKRFSARTISAFGVYTVHPTLLQVSNRLGTSRSSSSSRLSAIRGITCLESLNQGEQGILPLSVGNSSR